MRSSLTPWYMISFTSSTLITLPSLSIIPAHWCVCKGSPRVTIGRGGSLVWSIRKIISNQYKFIEQIRLKKIQIKSLIPKPFQVTGFTELKLDKLNCWSSRCSPYCVVFSSNAYLLFGITIYINVMHCFFASTQLYIHQFLYLFKVNSWIRFMFKNSLQMIQAQNWLVINYGTYLRIKCPSTKDNSTKTIYYMSVRSAIIYTHKEVWVNK